LLLPTGVFAACKVTNYADLPVTMVGMRPTIAAQINGQDVRFLIDSGAFFSMISSATAAQYGLRLSPAPIGLRVMGTNGAVDASVATVKVFTFAAVPMHNVEFLVGGTDMGGGNIAGIVGQNLFRIGDVEYDLANGVIRLMRAESCSHARLAYWLKPSETYSLMDIAWPTVLHPHTTGSAYINGAKIHVMFDTGAATSLLSMKAAQRAGITPDSPGVVVAGYSTGLGRGSLKTYIGTFSSFKIGDEEIKNARLRFAQLDYGVDTDMLIGADFFLSHRIYVASSQSKLFFTYNGGPVFNLAAAPPPKSSTETPAADSAGGAPSAGEPTDAAGYSRRGTAFAARRDFEHALADLTRACEMAPDNAQYFYQRAMVYRDRNQPDPEMADLDRTLELKSDDPAALSERAALRLRGHDNAGATADMDALDRILAKENDLRLFLAQGYEHIDLLARSIAEYDLWILSHPDDARMPQALNSRCWARGLLGENLSQALDDCNRALRLASKASPVAARVLDSRGLVRLRMGDYDKSIADFDESVKLRPKDAWARYGRGVAKLRKNKVAEGEADMAAATALWAPIGEEFKRRGIAP
jgi:predicted aspartyl protease/Flp pilus assembly protein TadD